MDKVTGRDVGGGVRLPRGLLEPGVRPNCTALAWSCSVMLPGVAKAARSLHKQGCHWQQPFTLVLAPGSCPVVN